MMEWVVEDKKSEGKERGCDRKQEERRKKRGGGGGGGGERQMERTSMLGKFCAFLS